MSTYYNASPWNGQIPTHVYHRAKIVYVEVPKAGCTSIKSMLAPLRGDEYTGEDIHEWTGYVYARGLKTLYAYLDNRWPDFFKFTVVREPIDRFQSFFYGLNVGEKIAYNGSTDINEFVMSKLEFNPWMSDIHAVPQHWLTGDRLGHYTHLGTLETIEKTVDAIIEWTGTEVHMPHLNKSRRTDTLSMAARRKLSRMFEEDFKLYGYRRSS